MSTLTRDLERLLFAADKVQQSAKAEGRDDVATVGVMVVRLVPLLMNEAVPQQELDDFALRVSQWRVPLTPTKKKGAK